MIYGYIRVSTVKQASEGNSLEGQKKLLLENGVKEENIYKDIYTGTKSDRPSFNELINKLEQGDTLVVTKLDRFSRSASAGIKLIDSLLEKGVKVHILNIGLMDTTPTGKLIRNIFFSFAEFERDMIVERTQEGKAIAKQKPGFKDGRKRVYDEKKIKHAMKLKEEGYSYKQVTEVTGISKATLIRRMKEYQ